MSTSSEYGSPFPSLWERDWDRMDVSGRNREENVIPGLATPNGLGIFVVCFPPPILLSDRVRLGQGCFCVV